MFLLCREEEEREAELLKSLVDTDELNRAPSPLELPEEPVIQKANLPPRQRKVSRFEVFSTLKAAGLKTSRSQEPLSITRELFDTITVEEESQETYEDEVNPLVLCAASSVEMKNLFHVYVRTKKCSLFFRRLPYSL